jgi:hypothetical protein
LEDSREFAVRYPFFPVARSWRSYILAKQADEANHREALEHIDWLREHLAWESWRDVMGQLVALNFRGTPDIRYAALQCALRYQADSRRRSKGRQIDLAQVEEYVHRHYPEVPEANIAQFFETVMAEAVT